MVARTKRTAKTRSTHNSAPAALTAVQRRELVTRPFPSLGCCVPGKSWGGAYVSPSSPADKHNHQYVDEDEGSSVS